MDIFFPPHWFNIPTWKEAVVSHLARNAVAPSLEAVGPVKDSDCSRAERTTGRTAVPESVDQSQPWCLCHWNQMLWAVAAWLHPPLNSNRF